MARAGGHEWVALDFETATSSRASACSVGLAYVRDGRIQTSESFLIRPPRNEYSGFNISIHGIRPAMTADAPSFRELWPTLEARIGGLPVVAHNASFDMSVLRHELDRMGRRYPQLEYYCTLVLSRAAWPRLYDHTLPTVASHCGVDFRHHDAAEDARACAEIVLRLGAESGAGHPSAVAERHGVRPGRLYAGGYECCSGRR